MRIRHLIIILFLFIGEEVLAQSPYYKNFTTDNRLISNTIYDVKQDKTGFIWIASDKGLTRFDGLRFKHFSIRENKSSSVSNILFTNNGQIYVQNFKGQYFKVKADYLVYQPAISKHSNFNLGHDFDGNHLAFLVKNKIFILNNLTNQLSKLPIEPGFWIAAINSTKSHYYLSNLQINKTLKINQFGKITISSKKIPFKNDYNFWIIDHQNEYFVAKLQKKIFDEKTRKYIDFSHLLPDGFVQNVSLIEKGKLAILTTNGVILFDSKTKKLQRIFEDFSFSKLITDKQGNWWLSTIGNGVLFIPYPKMTNYLKDEDITSLSVDSTAILFGTKSNSIYLKNTQIQASKLLLQEPLNHEIKSLFYASHNDNLLYCSFKFKHLKNKKLIAEFPISINKIIALDKEHFLLCESSNLTIYPVSENDKWLKWNKNKSKIEKQRLALFKENKRFLDAVFYNNSILALASDGLWKINQFGIKKLKINNLNEEIIDLFKSEKGVLLGTEKNKIYSYRNGKLCELSQFNDLLKSDNLKKVKFYNNHYFFLTNSGLIIADEKGKFIEQIFDLKEDKDLTIKDFVIVNSIIYLTSNKGYFRCPLVPNFKRTENPKIVLNEFSVNGAKIAFKNNVRLNADQNEISFSFSVLDFNSLGNQNILFSINGKEWRETVENSVNLNELAPGLYTISVQAFTNGNSRSNILSYQFEIIAPFYQRWWFILILLSIIGVVGHWIFKIRLNQIETKNQILQEKLDLEKRLHESSLAAIKSQMKPHFLFNALNTIQSFIYTNEKEAASSYLVDFSELTRKILEMSNKDKVLLSEEITALSLYLKLEKMRFEEDFNYEINTEKLPHLAFQIPSMLIQPYVENAIKHGLLHKKGTKKLLLQFQFQPKLLIVTIEDNGIGRVASSRINANKLKTHKSFATAANQKRFDLLNQLSKEKIGVEFIDLMNENGEALGTKVILSIPI